MRGEGGLLFWRVIYLSFVVATAAGLAACSPESGKSTTPKSSGRDATQIAGNAQVTPGPTSSAFITREPNGSITYRSAQPDAARARMPRAVPGELLVKFKPQATRASSMSALSQVSLRSARAYRSIPGLHHVKLALGVQAHQAMATYLKHPDVAYVEPNYIVSINAIPNDPSFPSQVGFNNTGQTGFPVDADIDAPEAWDITTGSNDVVVAVIDTGVDYNHQDLAANIFQNTADCNNNDVDDDGNGHIDDCHGIDAVNGDSDPMDDHGHGTHVAGIIGAVGNNGIGVAGVAWNVKILPCKFLDATGSGFLSDAIACLDYVAAMKDRGVNIVATNNSWGGGSFSQALSDAIDAQMQRGILFVAAAGNDGEEMPDVPFYQDSALYPCAHYLPNVICVGATGDDDTRARFSNYGRQTVHLGAPGNQILSTLPGNSYGVLSGTSMATPHVTGAIALLKSANSNLDWRATKNLILAGGDVKPFSAPQLGSDFTTISGRRLNANGALTCNNSSITRRVQPRTRERIGIPVPGAGMPTIKYHHVGEPLTLAVLNIQCANPNGAVSVTISPGDVTVTLSDDGLGSDRVAGDGIYSNTWTPTAGGTYTLTFLGTSPLPGSGTVSDTVTVNVDPHLRAGFPVKSLHLPGFFAGSPNLVVGNIDASPDLEILAPGLAGGPIYAWKANGAVAAGWPVGLIDGGVGLLALGNLVGAGDRLEVVAGRADSPGTIEAYSGSGVLLNGWPKFVNYVGSMPTLVDIDGDGTDEVFADGEDFSLHGYRSDGTDLPGFPVPTFTAASSQLLTTPLAADIDSDGRPELITTSFSNAGTSVFAFHSDGSPVSGFPVSSPGDIFLIGVGDVDGDGQMEIVGLARATSSFGAPWNIVQFRADGTVKRSIPIAGQPLGGALADLNQDGIPEIVYIASDDFTIFDGNVRVVNGFGTPLSGWPVALSNPTRSGDPISSPVVGDVDGDGMPEVVLVAFGALHVLKQDGTYVSGFPKRIDELSANGIAMVPVIADVDNDGRNEIVVASDFWQGIPGFYNKIWVYGLGGPTPHGPIEWGQFMEGPQHRGYYETGKNLPNHAYLTAQVRGAGTISSTAPGINCGTDCIELYPKGMVVSLAATPAEGQIFVRWFGACAGQANPCTVSVQKYTAVAAQFGSPTPVLLSVSLTGSGTGTVVSSPGGIQCGADCSEPYNPGTVVTLTATPGANSVFSNWSGACSGASPTCDVTMDLAKSVTATFTTTVVPTRLLAVTTAGTGIGTVTSSPAGIACGADCSEPYNLNTVVTLTATPSAASVFSGWTGACSGSSVTCNVTMDAAKSVTATFTLKPVLTVAIYGTGTGTVTSAPAGINCGGDCSEAYSPNTVVALTAVPSTGSVFSGWSDACTGSGGCSITMDAAKSVTATFTLKPVLTVAMSGTGAGSVTSSPAGINCGADCSEPYNPNVVVSLTAIPSQGSVFDTWSGACAGQGNPCAVTMDSAKAVTAAFAVAGSPNPGGGGGGGGGGGSSGGGGGGGCTIGTDGKPDPSLPALLVLATMALWRRRRT